MKKIFLAYLCFKGMIISVSGQETRISGSVKDAVSFTPISEVLIEIEQSDVKVYTDDLGRFSIKNQNLAGNYILKVFKAGYISKRFPVIINQGSSLVIDDILMQVDIASKTDLYTIMLSDDELNEDASEAVSISGLLQAAQDVFQRTAAFEFSSSFFKIRGLDSSEGSLLINGVEMNSFFNGRPQWSNWGGINDVLRNQELNFGLSASYNNFGGLLGTVNITTLASQYKQGGRVTYSASNRSYANRLMASYASGMLKKGWAYALSLGRRWGNEGYQDATSYNANSFFITVEKSVNNKHALNFTGIYTPNKRGKSSPNTQEVYDLKDIKYNEYWGVQNGENRNSRIKDLAHPIFILSHIWDIKSNTSLHTNVSYVFGRMANSRLDYPGGGHPSPTYYQKLPSYYLANANGPDYTNAYLAQQEFQDDGQIDWSRIYDANITNKHSGEAAAYILYDDVVKDEQFGVNTIFNTQISSHISLQAALNFKSLLSENYGEISDLLDADHYLNVDAFDGWQYDYQHPNRLVAEGDKIKYNYIIQAQEVSAFAQTQFKFKTIDSYLALTVNHTNYQREGLFEHEAFLNNSLGKSEALKFTGFGFKGGFTYKLSSKHIAKFHAVYMAKSPNIQDSFSNPRENNALVKDISNERNLACNFDYVFRSAVISSKITGYYIEKRGGNEIGFYYADGLTSAGIEFNETSAFVQEILQNVNTLHYGVEIGVDARLTSSLKLKGVMSCGQYIYNNNPDLYLTSSSFVTSNGAIDFGKAYLKNYKLSAGPQAAYSFGFEYSDPDYWWFGTAVNYFTHTYLDVSPLTRTSNFYLDDDGLPLNDYDESTAKQLLKQERFNDYLVVNLTGGKSWKIYNYYLGLFVSINNLLDKTYKTGGFEQGRNANYSQLKADVEYPKRVFGPKYWYGRGTTYFVNVNVRF